MYRPDGADKRCYLLGLGTRESTPRCELSAHTLSYAFCERLLERRAGKTVNLGFRNNSEQQTWCCVGVSQPNTAAGRCAFPFSTGFMPLRSYLHLHKRSGATHAPRPGEFFHRAPSP
jgi:hypothetical protein